MLKWPKVSLSRGGKTKAAAPQTAQAPAVSPAEAPVGKKGKAAPAKQPKPRDTRPLRERYPGFVAAFGTLGVVVYWVFIGWWCWPLENTLNPLIEWVESHPRAGFWSALGVLLFGCAAVFSGALLAAQTKSALPFAGAVAGFALLLVCLRCALLFPISRKVEAPSVAAAPEVPEMASSSVPH